MKQQQQRYTPEFRAEAIKLVTEQGLSQREAAIRLSIPKGTLANWMAVTRNSISPSASGGRSAAELTSENARLRKEPADVLMEREILKKAGEYFTKELLHGTRS